MKKNTATKQKIIITTLFLLSSTVEARTCTSSTNSATISPTDIILQKNLPVGSPIGPSFSTNQISTYSCSGEGSGERVGFKAYGTYVKELDGASIYSTNIEGIGYAIFGIDNTYCENRQAFVVNQGNLMICGTSGAFSSFPWKATLGVQLYKYAEKTGSGSVDSRTVGAFILKNDSMGWARPEVQVTIDKFNIHTVDCRLLNSSTSVDMGSVNVTQFKGIGTHPADDNTKEFSINTDCSSGVKLKFNITGNMFSSEKGVLNTTPGEKNSQGVGLQLLYNDKPLPLGKDIEAGGMVDGVNSLKIKARYYQIENKIKPGIANSNAIITVTFY